MLHTFATMSEVLEQQKVTLVDPLDFGGAAKAVVPPAQSQPQQTQEQAAPATPAAEPAAVDKAVAEMVADTPATPEVKAPDAAPAETIEDPLEKAVSGLFQEDKPIEWSEDAKKAFAAEFGVEDPASFKTEYQSLKERHEIVAKENEALSALKRDIESMTPAMLRAIELFREGKDPLEYLKSLPDGVFHNKPAAELTDRQLLDTYAKGKVTPEQWDKLNDPDTDPEVADAIKEKIAHYRDIAAEKHEAARQSTAQDLSKAEEARKQAFESFRSGVANTIAFAKNDRFAKAFVDKGHVDEMSQPGVFLSRFLESDGVTPKPQALALVLKAERFEEAVKAAEKVGYKRGYESGVLEGNSKLPTAPSARRGVVTPPSPEQTKQSPAEATLDMIERGISR